MRFLPGSEKNPPFLYGTDGLIFSIVALDRNVPLLLLDGHLLAKVSKDPGELELIETGYGLVQIKSSTATYALESIDEKRYPFFPYWPESGFVFMEAWDLVRKVFYAAAKAKEASHLAFVHFASHYVEATDQARIARVGVEWPYSGVVPSAVFRSFPEGFVQVAFTEEHAFFSVGDEMRIAPLFRGSFVVTDKLLPANHAGARVLLSTSQFQHVVSQGQLIAERGFIHLYFSADCVNAECWGRDIARKVFIGSLPVLHAKDVGQPVKILVDGRYLKEALRPVETPNVQICFSEDPVIPLRIESGAYVACVWQMLDQ
jgi:DNA polymerase III sliding clamp (beta) subunit (PCNA family)